MGLAGFERLGVQPFFIVELEGVFCFGTQKESAGDVEVHVAIFREYQGLQKRFIVLEDIFDIEIGTEEAKLASRVKCFELAVSKK